MLNEALSKNLYHFTTIQGAYNIMRNNVIYLSQTTPNSADSRLSHKRLFFLSCTRNKNILTSEYPKQQNAQRGGMSKLLVRFWLNGEVFKENGIFGKPVSFFKEKLSDVLSNSFESNKKSSKSNLNLFKRQGLEGDLTKKALTLLANDLDTEEDRIASNSPTIQNFIQYVNSVDVLLDKAYDNNIKPQSVVYYFQSIPTEWINLIRFYTNTQDFNTNGEYHSLDDLLDEYGDENKELILTDKEISNLKKLDKTKITTNGLMMLSRAIYTLYYTNEGLDKTKTIARNKMLSYGLNVDITLETKNDGKKNEEKINLIDGVINLFGDVYDEFQKYSQAELVAQPLNAFRTFVTYADKCRFVNIALLQMYSDWLEQYKKQIKHKVKEFATMLENSSEEVLENIIMNYINIFKKAFQKIIEEYGLYSLNTMITPKKIKKLVKVLGNSRFVKIFISEYRKEFYHYDEICYFKRSVMMYKNKMISSIRRTPTRLGDLANLYNNADDANKKMLK